MQHRGKVPRLELQRAADVAQALGVAAEQVVERGALVPGFGEIGRPAQKPRKPGLRDVVAAGCDVARGELKGMRRAVVRMAHPDVPDLPFGGFRLVRRAAREAAEELIQERQRPRRPPGTPGGDQTEDVFLAIQCRPS